LSIRIKNDVEQHINYIARAYVKKQDHLPVTPENGLILPNRKLIGSKLAGNGIPVLIKLRENIIFEI